MFKRLLNTRSLCISAVIAALYAALTLLLAPISYGNLQCRVSEALTILPVLLPEAVPGLAVGCLIANLFGPATPWDIAFGTLATLLAAVLSWITRERLVTKLHLPLLSALWPVLCNGVIVGLVLSLALGLPLLLTMLEVAVGEAVALLLGLALYQALKHIDMTKIF
ncbi:MAG: QueT transporter family protein [Clostridia bacterium]|nr:QueT transporter family protein [Clostridia bacterium]